jgi:2-dehydro-3-deoxygluconokinase
MSEDKNRVIAVGEVMIELARGNDGRFALSCGGDTFNTAIYLARAGINVAYATALGDDRYYLIEANESGERIFSYWRDSAPARDLFELPDWGRIAEGLMAARMIYFSGITLSLYSNNGLGRFIAILELARKKGTKIAFDGNFRPKGWKGDLGRTRAVYIEALKRVDIALPTYDDEAVLWGDPSPEATVDRLQAFGIGEIAVKNGPHGALIASDGQREFVPVAEVIEPLDITAAGDSFNAAYLAARLTGDAPAVAASAGHKLAAQKIRHRGAIMPRASVPVH